MTFERWLEKVLGSFKERLWDWEGLEDWDGLGSLLEELRGCTRYNPSAHVIFFMYDIPTYKYTSHVLL